MREALLEADRAGQAGEIPIGAVVVVDKKIISRGRAQHNEVRSQLSHAELIALQTRCKYPLIRRFFLFTGAIGQYVAWLAVQLAAEGIQG